MQRHFLNAELATPEDPGYDPDPETARAHAFFADETPIGAATFLLNPTISSQIPRVVLEGAPGQGKSTLAQYICQVHRMRLLRMTVQLRSIPPGHSSAPIRLPIKVDLRDFATWLSGRNPFAREAGEKLPGHHKSLETFLAFLISHQSGGTAFTTDDLLAVARISSLLLVLDGLDEVAEINIRQSVVSEIVDGTRRLSQNSASLQTIVTSRPAAFANSPGMPPDQYCYFQLTDLSQQLIFDYAELWMKARRLDDRLSTEFREVLKAKLQQPRLRDLARNPMQLAILLSLILTRGSSLPDKRTALYDFYMELFLNRESEKNRVVREHRDLLVELHRYLAWLLHSESEKGKARASISQERLLTVVTDYLRSEGYDAALATQLFTGMVERVVALVSRVQGTFEFEVQPLREYFAACFLFYTAPHSSPGKEKQGTRPDRFDAICNQVLCGML
jgi:predicted NACHT family NTPase